MSLTAALFFSTGLAAVALWKKALTAGGTALAWICCLLIAAGGGMTAYLILLTTFAGTVAADRAANGKADPYGLRRKSGSRGIDRVFCNVGVGTAAVSLFILTGNRLFLISYAAVMAESLADSLASKIGPLSKKQPFDILTFNPVPTGLSGGVTKLGTIAEGLGAFTTAAVYALGEKDIRGTYIVFISGFAGALADSVLGSGCQKKYQCKVCGMVTEREDHCGQSTVLMSGWSFMTNDTVNLCSNITAFVLSLILSFMHV